MAFQVPSFNIAADVWHPPNAPPAVPDDTVDCQLRAAGKQSTGQDSNQQGWPFLWALLVAAGTDLRDVFNGGGQDTIECPPGTGRFYKVELVDDVARGFTNEYRIAFIRKTGTWPTPVP